MKKQDTPESEDWVQKFEENYILTCHELYHYVLRSTGQEDKARELLIRTYMEAYHRKVSLPSTEKQLAWLIKVADSLMVNPEKETEAAASAEEGESREDGSEKDSPRLDEASVLLEIEDRLKLLDDTDSQADQKSKMQTAVQGGFSIVLLIVAVTALVVGVGKARKQLNVLREPFVRTMAQETDDESLAAQENSEERIKIGGKAVFLSDIGEVLYSLPLSETDMAGEETLNPEIQKQAGWTYYLPCPERTGSQLTKVAPPLYHTLYRMSGDGEEIEIVAREVDDYVLWEDGIYVSQFDRIQRIDKADEFEKEMPGIYVEVKNNEIYLYNMLGGALETDADGNISYGDRIFQMVSNRLADVKEGTRSKDHVKYYLKDGEDGNTRDIYRNVNGQEELFASQDQMIDSFCIAGDWVYYSAYIRRGGSGANYSELYRKSLTEDKKAELLHEEYTGRIRQMYFNEENHQIYANYIPKNWKNNHGVIAAISMSGQMSYLEDEGLRSAVETTGNDMLEFIMEKDGLVYCYWKDCIWEKGETPIAIWRKVLVIPDDSRIQMDEEE